MKGVNKNISISSIGTLLDLEALEPQIFPHAINYINYNELLQYHTTSDDKYPKLIIEDKYTKSIKENYHLITENPILGVIRCSYDGRITFANNTICNMLGYRKDEIKHSHFSDFSHPDDYENELELLNKMCKGEIDNYQIEKRFITKQKNIIWAEVNLSCLRKDGKIQRVIGVIQDITARKFMENELQKSEANLNIILNNSDTGYVLFDSEFKILSFNQLALQFSQAEYKKPLIKGSLSKNYFSRVEQIVLQKKLNYNLDGNIHNYEASFSQPDGSIRWYYTRFFRVKTIDGNTFGVIMALTDITERKLSEIERDKITSDLIQHNKDLEQFAYIVSHNLRSPVANIIGLSNLLGHKEQNSDDERSQINKRLFASAEKLDSVIKDLNNILQVKREIKEKKEVVQFSSLVDNIKISISQLLEKENVKIIVDFKQIESMVTLKSYMHSIFYNLISNSIKYRQLAIPLIIRINSYKVNNKLILLFEDNGLGIDLKKMGDQVFGLYKRFHPSIEGKGFGLFMVKTQVEALQGKISLKSAVNKGTRFMIIFDL